MFGNKKSVLHLCTPNAQGKREFSSPDSYREVQSNLRKGEFSSVGSEHLPYKQRVGGSNPSTPTVASTKVEAFFVLFFNIRYSDL